MDGLTHKIFFCIQKTGTLTSGPRSRSKQKSMLKLVFLASLSGSGGLFFCQLFHCSTLVSLVMQLDTIEVLGIDAELI